MITLLESVHVADDIVDLYYYLSREIDRMAKAYSAGLEMKRADWDSVYENMLAFRRKISLKAQASALLFKREEILELRKEIEVLEEQGDDIKDQGFDRLYSITSNLNYLQFFHYLNSCINVMTYLIPARTFQT